MGVASPLRCQFKLGDGCAPPHVSQLAHSVCKRRVERVRGCGARALAARLTRSATVALCCGCLRSLLLPTRCCCLLLLPRYYCCTRGYGGFRRVTAAVAAATAVHNCMARPLPESCCPELYGMCLPLAARGGMGFGTSKRCDGHWCSIQSASGAEPSKLLKPIARESVLPGSFLLWCDTEWHVHCTIHSFCVYCACRTHNTARRSGA